MKKEKNMLLFFLKMIVFFIIFDILLNNVVSLTVATIGTGKFGREVIAELGAVFLALIILLIFKNSYIYSEKKVGFFKAIKVGAFMLIFSVFMLIFNFIKIKGKIDIFDLLSLILYCFLIGVFEEFLCRGWIQNEFIERFAKNRKQVILSITLSSLIFGAMHISNIWVSGQDVLQTIAQIIQATGLGILLGSVYYRTKNIWSSVFLHGFWDFAILIGEINLIKRCVNSETTLNYSLYLLTVSILMAIFYFLISLYILRKSKTNNIIEEYTEEEIKISESNSSRLLIFTIIFYFCINQIPIQEVEEICYDYSSKAINYNEVVYPEYNKYTIKENNLNLELSVTDNHELLIKDLGNNTEKIFDDSYIDSFIIIKNNDNYTIIIRALNEYQNDTIIYYSNYISLNNNLLNTNKEECLNNLIFSIKNLDTAPTTYRLGYIESIETNIKYPFIETSTNDKLILIDEEFYLLEKTSQELKEEQNEENKTPTNDSPENNELPLPFEVTNNNPNEDNKEEIVPEQSEEMEKDSE